MAEQTVQVSPMAVAKEATVLNEFYRKRCLLLANEVEQLMDQVSALEAELADARGDQPEAEEQADG